jgi:hypothetical protein
MVSDDERYKFVTSQLTYHNEKIIEAFNLFIKLTSAVAGGAIWLRVQATGPSLWPTIRPLAVGLLVLFGISAALLVGFNLHTWWGFRKAESRLTNGAVRAPSFPGSCRQELVMVAVIIATTVAGGVALAKLY